VDKDNHLRDALKYLVLSLPEPTERTEMMRAREAMKGMDATSVMAHYGNMWEKEPEPIFLGRWTRARWRFRHGKR
jgi:hypothetical protein